MKKLYLLSILLLLILNSTAQNTYSWSAFTGQTFIPIQGGYIINDTAQLSAGQSGDADDGTALVTLPFTFTYFGQGYTQVTFCTNGWIGMGDQTLSVSTAQSRNRYSLFNTSAPHSIIAAWFKDGSANFPAPGNGSMVHGLVDTDVYAFEWRNAKGYGLLLSSASTINYMIKLYGPASSSPGRIEIFYGPQVGLFQADASIGIKDSIGGTGHYYNGFNGMMNSASTASAWPGNGKLFRFQSLYPCTPTLNGGTAAGATSVCPGVTFSLSITGATEATGLTYQWQSSADNITWSDISGATNAGYTSPGINVSTYFRRKIICGSNETSSVPVMISISAANVCPPSNDEPCNAITLTPSADSSCTVSVIGTTAYATTSTGYGYNNPLECGVANSPKDVWYKVTTAATGPASTILQFRLSKPAGSTMSSGNMTLLKANGTCPNITFSLISGACRNSNASFNTIELRTQFLTPNTTYYLRVNPVSNNDSTGTFRLCTFLPDPTPACVQYISPAPNATNVPVNQFITFQWTASPGAVLYDRYLGTTNPPTALVHQGTGLTDSSKFLLYNKKYYWYIAPRNSSGSTQGCAIDSFTTAPAPALCVPLTISNCSTNDTLKLVKITGEQGTFIDNPSGCSPGGYSDYTATTNVILGRGRAYSGMFHTSFVHNYITIWIDFNDDGYFTPDERILNNLKQQWSGLPTPLSVNIPDSAAIGQHRMRVRNVYYAVNPNVVGGTTDPCNNYNYSETEDYSVTIIQPLPGQRVASATANHCEQAGFLTVDQGSNNNNSFINIVDDNNELVASLNANGNDLGTVSASVYRNDGALRTMANGIKLLDRNIVIKPRHQPVTPVLVRLYLTHSEFTALQVADPALNGVGSLMITKTTDTCINALIPASGTEVVQVGSGMMGSDYYVDVMVNEFSNFFIHRNPAGAIPQTSIVSFTGQRENNMHILNWHTGTEAANAGFEVERSHDSLSFSVLEFIPSLAVNGNSNTELVYSYTDQSPLSGKNYYRLKQQSISGNINYSQVISIENPTNPGIQVTKIYPVPVKDRLNFEITSDESRFISIQIMDIAGKRLMEKKVQLISGSNAVSINTSSLSQGTYLVHISCSGYCDLVRRFVKFE